MELSTPVLSQCRISYTHLLIHVNSADFHSFYTDSIIYPFDQHKLSFIYQYPMPESIRRASAVCSIHLYVN
ncbi:hypothetical protein FKM82_019374 [Ascaphus truei]